MDNELQSASRASDLLFRVRAFIFESGRESEFDRLALDVFGFQFEAVPIYRMLCERRGINPGSVKHWNQIPALPVSAFKEHIVSSLRRE